jgi:hypothetical protein
MRFATVVEKAGQPDVHLMLVAPEKDDALQKAIKANRVMVVHQSGSDTDYGTVGFERAAKGQILVFPRSLEPFEGARIVGVNYELLESASARKKPQDRKSKSPNVPPKRKAKDKTAAPVPPTSDKVVTFRKPEPEEEEEDEEVTDLKSGIHHAMELLEAGKQVTAFNILKRLVE